MKFRRTNVLVVGGEGFIGKNLRSIYKPKIRWHNLDLKSKQDVLDGIHKKYDAIVWLACNFTESEAGYKDNLEMFHALDNYMMMHLRTHIIYTSSAAVYKDVPYSSKETDALLPTTFYGKGKMFGEKFVNHCPRHTILRLSNVYGLGGRGVIDLFKAGKNEIHGDGNQVRDFVFVDDVCNTIVDAIENPRKWRGTFNVGVGFGLSVNTVFKMFGQGKPEHIKDAPTGVRCSVLDNCRWERQWSQ